MERPTSERLAHNGALLMLPPLLLSLGLWPFLPAAYQPEMFSLGVPPQLRTAENLLRVLTFALPLALRWRATGRARRSGRSLYLAGLLTYALSYLLLVGSNQTGSATPWAMSWLGFTAPAWTPALWIAGLAMMCREEAPAGPRWWGFVAAASAFLTLHLAHASIVWARLH